MQFLILYLPCSNKKEAIEIGTQLVNNKLAACVNIIDSITSIYEWEGCTKQSQECLLLIKTTKALVQRSREFISKQHSYEIPCIAEINIDSLNSVFAEWMLKQL